MLPSGDKECVSIRSPSNFETEGARCREHDFLDWNIESLGEASERRSIRECLHLAGRNLLDASP